MLEMPRGYFDLLRRVERLEHENAVLKNGGEVYPDEMTTEQAARFLGYRAGGCLLAALKRRQDLAACGERRAGGRWWWSKAKLERARAGR